MLIRHSVPGIELGSSQMPRITVGRLKIPYGMPGIKPGLTLCKANALPALLFALALPFDLCLRIIVSKQLVVFYITVTIFCNWVFYLCWLKKGVCGKILDPS